MCLVVNYDINDSQPTFKPNNYLEELVMNGRFLKRKAYLRTRDGDDEDGESFHLLSANGNESDADSTEQRRSSAQRAKRSLIHYIEHSMQSDETLSSLALRYNCSVAQIKQANNILRENEVFALRKVRIPVSAFSSLRDEVPAVHSAHLNSKKTSESICMEDDTVPVGSLVTETDWDVRGPNQSDEELRDPLLTPIPQPRLPLVDLSSSEPLDLDLSKPIVQEKRSEGMLQCSGADCGISWIALLVCTLVLGFAGPLIYIFFLYEHEQEEKLHNHTGT